MTELLLHNRELFLDRVVDRLGANPLNFREKQDLIGKSASTSLPQQAAGVILPLFYSSGEFYFRLCKRSRHIPQPGDLSCPGGILHVWHDMIVSRLITSGIISVLHNKAGMLSRQRDAVTFRLLALFLATALREAWEEIRLNPLSTNFLGPLPAYSLQLFRRVIFPLVVLVPESTRFHPNYEVESLVDIPVAAFFFDDNYGALVRELDGRLVAEEAEEQSLPCLFYRDPRGVEHVLWGATFVVIISFLEIVFDFRLPEWKNKRLVTKAIDAGYLSGEGGHR